MKRLFALIAVLLFLSECKKEDSPSESYADDYRFYLKGELNGKPVEYNAGENDYFLETGYTFKDSVVEMQGALYQVDAPHRNAFYLRIRGSRTIGDISTFDVSQNLGQGWYAFRDQSGFKARPESYIYTFLPDTTSTSLNYSWDFGDGGSSTSYQPTKKLELDLYKTFEVTMNTTSGSGCNSSVTHVVNVKDECDATFRLDLLSSTLAKVEVIGRQGTISKTTWFVNGTEVSPDDLGQLTLSAALDIEIKAVVAFEGGCVSEITRVVKPGLVANCITDFTYTREKEKIYDPTQLATVEVIYFDENGKEYSSYYSDVEGDFKIESFGEYLTNEKGQPTSKFLFEMDCVLKSVDGDQVELRNFFGHLAVAHP